MNEAQREQAVHREAFSNAVVAEIMEVKAQWIRACYKYILPPELYELAAKDEQLERCRTYAREQGYVWKEFKGESRLYKATEMVGLFKPVLEGGKIDPHIAFIANVGGVQIPLVRLAVPAYN